MAIGERYEGILKAAGDVIARRGFHQASIREIARAAGVGDGTIYLYFKNKDDLLICLFEEKMGELNEAMPSPTACTVP